MHVVIGGAHNGKREYVREMLAGEQVEWIEAGELSRLPQSLSGRVVLAGLESYLSANHENEETAMEDVFRFVQAADRERLTIIVTDIGRGIVPADPHTRWLRDVCGRLNQRLFREAGRVTRIWYGLAQELK
ncbi:bifunctional adenosylcobinamide kinase/adenosylcobinamide-phosphate guanylyltransferase [Bhargavaea massiliensis]|uniref:bifunctional adenosylcobinamide kinase/adenosylcobinamide-phosphate guanylyltransferase n=1 Tax=Bhargavaea massiliensis TaxID=2697500 RepID=UPI001BCD7DB1